LRTIEGNESTNIAVQRDLSPRTVSVYRDPFRLLLRFLQQACGKRSDQLMLSNLTAAQLIGFLQYLEEERGSGELPVAAPSPHFPSHHSPRDGHELAS
jgi:hypothetical protein